MVRAMPNDPGPAGPFSELVALLTAAVSRRDYEAPALDDAVARGARAARASGLTAREMLAALRTQLRVLAAADIGEQYRGALIDRFVARAVEAYYANAK